MSYVEVPGAKVPIRMWADPASVEDVAMQQLRNVSTLPWIKGLAVMPDVHYGKGATVGSVIAMHGAVCPAAVGVDIGCGMSAVRTSLTANDLPGDLSRLRSKVEQAIPVGRGMHDSPVDPGRLHGFADRRGGTTSGGGSTGSPRRSSSVRSGPRSRWERSDRGNHFVEVCTDTTGSVWLMLHSGSRNIGKELAEHPHRCGPEAAAQPGPGRSRPRRLHRGHPADGGLPERPLLGAGVREVQPRDHDGAPEGRDPQGVQEGEADLRAGDHLPPQLRGRGAVRGHGPARHPQGRDPRRAAASTGSSRARWARARTS